MANRYRKWIFNVSWLTVASIVAATSSAAALESSSGMVCAAPDAVACTSSPGCLEGRAKSFDLPELVIVDMEKKVIRASEQSGIEEVSPIKNSEESGNHLIIQGVENGRGWGISVDRENGAMTATVSGDGISFILFGTCTAI